ncbi:hypothetical protein LTR86_007717 [Recurvomyces mirabilis]|nr:hypothetical protein LTR86_007717 [Recurvomyces mirabilis]
MAISDILYSTGGRLWNLMIEDEKAKVSLTRLIHQTQYRRCRLEEDRFYGVMGLAHATSAVDVQYGIGFTQAMLKAAASGALDSKILAGNSVNPFKGACWLPDTESLGRQETLQQLSSQGRQTLRPGRRGILVWCARRSKSQPDGKPDVEEWVVEDKSPDRIVLSLKAGGDGVYHRSRSHIERGPQTVGEAVLLEIGFPITIIEIDTDDGKKSIHARQSTNIATQNHAMVVLVPGLGLGCLTFTTIQSELAKSGIASFTYDRLGIGRSSSVPLLESKDQNSEKKAPKARPASTLAQELDIVLHTVALRPPYIFITHSAGGLILWEYIAAHNDNVAGVVFLDANSPRSIERAVTDPDLEFLADGIKGGLDYCSVIGLDDAHHMSGAEWEELNGRRDPPEGWTKGKNGGWAEILGWHDSCRDLTRHDLASKHPLGDRPSTVIKGFSETDIRKAIAYSEAKGGGTTEQREELLRKMEGGDLLEEECQREHLMLTGTGERRFVFAHKSGHYPHITEQDLVVSEIERMVRLVQTSDR